MNVTKFPVVIFASPRTGSTALGHHIHNQYPELKYFIEPNFSNTEMEDYLEYSKSNNNYIVKLMASFNIYYPRTILSNDVFKIKISRRNVVEQIASFYVARQKDIWDYNQVNYNDSKDIVIELSEVRKCIFMVMDERNILDRITTDIELFYEDFAEFNSPTNITPKPSNYPLLLDTISKLI